MQRLLTTEEVADWLRVDSVTVRRLTTRGHLTAYRIGGEYRFKTTDLEEYLESTRVNPGFGGLKGQVKTKATRQSTSTNVPSIDLAMFTERAKEVLVLAQREARQFEHDFLGTEHLLLGLIDEGDGVAARVLRDLEVDAEGVRESVREVVGSGKKSSVAAGEIRLTPRSKRAIETSMEEARKLGHTFVGTEHLLLGLLHEVKSNGSGAGRILAGQGIDSRTVRERVVQALQNL